MSGYAKCIMAGNSAEECQERVGIIKTESNYDKIRKSEQVLRAHGHGGKRRRRRSRRKSRRKSRKSRRKRRKSRKKRKRSRRRRRR